MLSLYNVFHSTSININYDAITFCRRSNGSSFQFQLADELINLLNARLLVYFWLQSLLLLLRLLCLFLFFAPIPTAHDISCHSQFDVYSPPVNVTDAFNIFDFVDSNPEFFIEF